MKCAPAILNDVNNAACLLLHKCSLNIMFRTFHKFVIKNKLSHVHASERNMCTLFYQIINLFKSTTRHAK